MEKEIALLVFNKKGLDFIFNFIRFRQNIVLDSAVALWEVFFRAEKNGGRKTCMTLL